MENETQNPILNKKQSRKKKDPSNNITKKEPKIPKIPKEKKIKEINEPKEKKIK